MNETPEVTVEVEEVKQEAKSLELVKPQQETSLAGTGMWNGGQAFAEAMKMAKVLSMAPMVPQNYRGQPGNCLIALDMSQRMGMSPMMIMQNLYIVQGNPSWSGQSCIALINNCGRFGPLKFKEEKRDDGYFACTAYATELKTGEVVYGTTVDRDMAESCGWMSKNGSYWLKMPMQMARYRSAAFFARTYCPEALQGLYTVDEQADIHQSYEDETMKEIVENG